MKPDICANCGAAVSLQMTICPKCGKALDTTDSDEPAIHKLGGKLQAIGVVTLATGIVATVAGTWWGPALAFPGIVLFMLGQF